jgi:hypothetical protein
MALNMGRIAALNILGEESEQKVRVSRAKITKNLVVRLLLFLLNF